MVKLSIHSIVDVITNSSTVIYTYQDCTEQAKELLQEILSLNGEEKKVDDLFCIDVFLSDNENYTKYLSEKVQEGEKEYPEEYPANDYKKQDEYIEILKEKIMKGEIEKPTWMKDAEEQENHNGYQPDRSLHIIPKEEKYVGIVEKMKKFLDSPCHEATYNG